MLSQDFPGRTIGEEHQSVKVAGNGTMRIVRDLMSRVDVNIYLREVFFIFAEINYREIFETIRCYCPERENDNYMKRLFQCAPAPG